MSVGLKTCYEIGSGIEPLRGNVKKTDLRQQRDKLCTKS